MRSVQEIIAEARDTVLHQDAGPAWRCLQELAGIEKSGNAVPSSPEIIALKTNLRYVALPVLPLEEAAAILGREIMPLLSRGMDLDDRLSVRYAFTTYGEHGKEQQALRKAILGNQEQVGGKGVGTWLQEFDKTYNPDTRDNRNIFEFLKSNRQLSERDRLLLKLILSAYENWLATERLTIFDMAYLKQHPEILPQLGEKQSGGGPYASQAANVVYQNNRSDIATQGRGVVQLSLLKAISEYPRLNDQLITVEKIKVKSQPEPVRPSLSNWIHYYRNELGVGFHDQVTRGRFLFQSENGKRLNNEERERINLILKSIEEDFPLDIDTEHMTIVFPTRASAAAVLPQTAARPLFPPREGVTPARPVKPFQPSMPPAGLPVTPAAPVAQTPPVKPSFFVSKLSPAKNVAGETLHFSTGHVLPGEKNADGTAAKAAAPSSSQAMSTQPNPVLGFRPNSINQNRGTTLPRSPYSIRPLRMRSDTREEET